MSSVVAAVAVTAPVSTVIRMSSVDAVLSASSPGRCNEEIQRTTDHIVCLGEARVCLGQIANEADSDHNVGYMKRAHQHRLQYGDAASNLPSAEPPSHTVADGNKLDILVMSLMIANYRMQVGQEVSSSFSTKLAYPDTGNARRDALSECDTGDDTRQPP